MEIDSNALDRLFSESVYKLILSNPAQASEYRKITIQKTNAKYHVEKQTDTQVFHENLAYPDARALVDSLLGPSYRQCNAWDDQNEYSVRISKKGKAFFTQSPAAQPPKKQLSHNRKKNYILEEGVAIQPLVDMGILTDTGKVISSMYDKYKQINRFLEIVDDEIEKWDQPRIHVIDFGCGKSYLTFVLYHYLTAIRQLDVRMVGLDLKKEVIDHCNRTAQKYGYDGLSFELGDISGYQSAFPVDMVITLHACDTATDYALYHALRWNAKLIFSVPCCQHELNRQIKSDRLSALTRYGLIKERAAALFTDAIRANLLVYGGYEAQLLEFIELEHTPKNILIRARKAALPQKARTQAMDEVKRMMEEFSLQPTLYRLMTEDR